eukprot:93279_1
MAPICTVIILVLHYFRIISCNEKDEQSQHPASCMGLEDGEHYIRPILFIDNDLTDKDDYPSILVRCSKGWIIFDYSLDPHIKRYFTSFMPITDDFASMNVGLEHLNWPKWLQIKNSHLTISEDCNTCSNSLDIAYYMTGNYYQCSFATKSLCDMSPTTLECNQCSGLMHDNDIHPGLCTHIALSIDDDGINDEHTSHQQCVTAKWNFLPSIGLNGRFCPCIKPKKDSQIHVQPLLITDDEITVQDDHDCANKPVIELTNDDFLHGTYRIRSCGTYKLMEDVELNMNAPPIMNDDAFSPNDMDHDYWWPTEEQKQDTNQYPSDTFIGAYAAGFFAGITVETDDVIIDLNGKKLSQSYEFYIQQRVFSLIELGSKPFLAGQGPVNYGSNFNQKYPENIVIKNGVLGLTSHHGIHGNNNRNVEIKAMKIIDFEVAGISMNGFHGLRIEDVQVGPNYQQIPVTPQYAHGRFMLQRLQYIADKETQSVVIDGENVFVSDIIETLRTEMDDAFWFSRNDRENARDNLFINADGLPHGATLYGVFLNSEGASVFGLGLSPRHSSDLVLRNVIVKELRSNPMETVRAQLTRGPFNDLVDMKRIVDEDHKYRGNAYSNAQFALIQLIPDSMWSVLGHSFISKPVMRWIESNAKLPDKFKCNSDVMLHVTKGIFGIRIDNVRNVQIEGDLNIENVHNLGALGEDEWCGKYFNARGGGHHNQQYPQQIGYTGTEVHGLSLIGSTGNVNEDAAIHIHDLVSARGSCFGINIYDQNDIQMDDAARIRIDNVHSGAYLTQDEVDRLHEKMLPNTVPRTCAIDTWFDDDGEIGLVAVTPQMNIESKCITGFGECSFKYSLIDAAYTEDNQILNDDLMMGAVDNEDCLDDHDDEDILVVMSKKSRFHLETLHLLQMQANTMEYAVNNSKRVSFVDLGIMVGFGAVTVIMSLLYYVLCSKQKRNISQDLNDKSEHTPLITNL